MNFVTLVSMLLACADVCCSLLLVQITVKFKLFQFTIIIFLYRTKQEDRIFWKCCSGSRAPSCRCIQGRLNLLQVEIFQIVWIKALFFNSSGISSFFCPSEYLLLITVSLFFDRYKHNASRPSSF